MTTMTTKSSTRGSTKRLKPVVQKDFHMNLNDVRDYFRSITSPTPPSIVWSAVGNQNRSLFATAL